MLNRKDSSKSNAKDVDGNSNSGRTVGKLDNDDSGIPPTVTNTATDIESEASSVTDLEIQDIEGIGPTTAKRLKEAGIVSPMELAIATAEELATEMNISKCSCLYNIGSKTPQRLKGNREGVCYCCSSS